MTIFYYKKNTFQTILSDNSSTSLSGFITHYSYFKAQKNLWNFHSRGLSYVREKIRTPDTLVRSQVLYPAELRTHILFCFVVSHECRRPESNRYCISTTGF